MRPSRWAATRSGFYGFSSPIGLPPAGCTRRPKRACSGRGATKDGRSPAEPDGSVRSGTRSSLVTWQGSRFIFKERELTAAVRDYRADQTEWDLALARQCGVIRQTRIFDGTHVNHRTGGRHDEATVRWDGKDRFELDGVR